MLNIEEFVDFNPETDLPSLEGKVIFITGGTAGLGRETVIGLARHQPAHIYFSGRNVEAGNELIAELRTISPKTGATFVKMDMESLSAVKTACVTEFHHDRLDILMCNAGVMYIPPGVSEDGYERHFAINHLAHALIMKHFLPILSKTAQLPDSDVRIISLSSTAWQSHPRNGITFSALRTPQTGFMMGMYRYGQSKFANLVYAAEFARRHPEITSISVHPGAVKTDMTSTISFPRRVFLNLIFWFLGVSMIEKEQGRLSQLWAVAGSKKEDLVNGGFYMPVGRYSDDRLDATAKSAKAAEDLWTFTEDALARF